MPLLLFAALLALHFAGWAQALPRILLFTGTAPGAYRHDSIPVAADTITAMGNGSLPLDANVVDPSLLTSNSAARWETVHTEDKTLFEQSGWLNQFDLVAFVHTTDANPPETGSVLTPAGAKNLCTYFSQGGGFVGIHSASASMYSYGCYGRVLGAYFDYHPEIQNFTISAVDSSHLSTSRLPKNLLLYEELYHFRSDPRALPSPAHVLVTNTSAVQDPGVNLRNFRLGGDGPAPHPLAWYREGNLLASVDGNTALAQTGSLADNLNSTTGFETFGKQPAAGRSWYSSMGHANATWAIPAYRGHVLGGFAWVLQSR
ncbi:hypothetical protein FA10DRAFT_264856 [Acaromyces ingoldii]|uniref:ThuA-like domain-containing protein n=1 Tax=Acaromyces ingoldii TaxID=215250 RepID=A0A316YYW6_9BASI|nr:hypothetical protein FA10DRAFT_264856 [Acaromyces ingoldii]PWN94312.1 hypothetical protein FA10DRAFT_264856 [Acaromyces ingoldii]